MNLKNKKKINSHLKLWMVSQFLILILISFIAYKCIFSPLNNETKESLAYIVVGGLSGIILACVDLWLYNIIQKSIDSNSKFATLIVLFWIIAYTVFLIAIFGAMNFDSPKKFLPLHKGLLALIISFELSKKLAELRDKPQPNTIMIPCDRGDIKVELSPNGSGPELDFTKPQQFIFTSDDKTVKIHITSQDK